ncbi:GNAT family N-acetyltransferase [Roseibium sp. SCP14]|uniref:GNAT family N-acetyltransferase n=1 Tax=Roseibium sp. SCP14 TaxID=3141375 RepID=UPI00333D3BEF
MISERIPPSESEAASSARSWPEGLHIRAESPADAEAITALQNMPGYRAGTMRMPYPREKDVKSQIENRSGEVVSLVAVQEGIIVASAGFTRFSGRRIHAAIMGIGVHDDYTGRGIGRALMSELLEVADNWMNIRRLELTVFTDNVPAIRLYERAGFEIEGTLRSFGFRNGEYADAYSMARIRC